MRNRTINRWASIGISFALVVGILVAPVAHQPIEAQTLEITVCPTGCDWTTIQEAIDAAGPGQIVDVAGGTYPEALSAVSKSITIQGDPLVPTIVNASGFGTSTLTVDSASTITVRNLILTGGATIKGGGILNSGEVILDAVVVQGNAAEVSGFGVPAGGGIYNEGTLSLSNGSSVDNNRAGEFAVGEVTDSWVPSGSGYSCPSGVSYFQSFTPTSNSLARVDVIYLTVAPPIGSETVNIRQDTPTGPVVATSLPNGATAVVGSFDLRTPYEFSEEVLLDAGSVYVIEFDCNAGNGKNSDGYTGGQAFGTDGLPFSFGGDFGFVTYAAEVKAGNGGGIYNYDGSVSVSNSTVSGNTAHQRFNGEGFDGGLGGGVYNEGSIVITESTIGAGNSAVNGGGLFNSSLGEMQIAASTVSANAALDDGGGIASWGDLSLTNATVSDNSAGINGGGVFSGSDLALNGVTITENSADNGGGVYGSGSPVRIFNTLSFGNTAVTASPDCFNESNPGSVAGYNFVGDPTGCGNYSPGLNGNVAAGSVANLGPLADNGGQTSTHALLSGSDAVDAGDPGDTLTYPTFAGLPAPLTLNGGTGGAAIVNDGTQDVLRTNAAVSGGAWVAGSAFLTNSLPVDQSFTTTFDFRITPVEPWGGQISGDGFTFAISPTPTFLGSYGGRLGVGVDGGPVPPIVAIEFDTVNGIGDPGYDNHVGIDVNPESNGQSVISAVTAPTAMQLDDQTVRTAWIEYDAFTNLLTVRLAQQGEPRPTDALLAYEVDIPASLGANSAHFGFTGAGAVAKANHDVLSWTLATGISCGGIDQRGTSRFQSAPCDIGAFEADILPPDLANFSYDVTPDSAPVGVAVVPIVDIPIESIVGGSGAEYEASPLGSIPLGSIPLGSIDLNASPLGSIPLGSIPLGSIDVAGTPLGSIPLGSIPLGSIGGWEAVLVGSTLENELLQNITLNQVLALPDATTRLAGIDLNDITLDASPLGSISLPGIALGEADLLSMNAAACDGIPSFDCTAAATDTVLELEIASAPLGSIPLGSIPLGSIPLGSIPLGSIPLGSIPLGSIPLGSIPLGSIPLGSIDLLGAPLGSIPLGSIPLGSIPLGSIPLGSIDISGTPLGSIPLGSIGTGGACAVLESDTDTSNDCATLGVALDGSLLDLVLALEGAGTTFGSTPLGSIPLGSIPLGSIPLGSIPLGSIPLGSIDLNTADLVASPLGSIPLGSIGGGCSLLLGTDFECGTDLAGISDTSTLADVVAALPTTSTIGDTPLGSIPLGSIPLGSIPLGSIDLTAVELNGTPLGSIPLGSIGLGDSGLASSPLGSIPLGSIPLGSIDNVVTHCPVDCQIDTLGDAELAGVIVPGATLEDLGFYFTVTLGELLDSLTMEALYGPGSLGDGFDYGDLTLGQILMSILIESDYPWETLDLMALPLQEIAPTGTVTYSASFDLTGDGTALEGSIAASIPPGFYYVPNSALLSLPNLESSSSIADPTISEGAGGATDVYFDLALDAGDYYVVSWEAVPGFEIGTFASDADIEFSTDVPSPTGPTSDSTEVEVVEFFTGNDQFVEPSVIYEDTLVFSHISTPHQPDFFEFLAGPVGTRHAVFLSQFDADTDLVLYQPATEPVSAIEPRNIPLGSIPIEDDGVDYGLNATEEPELEADISIESAPLGSISINRGTTPESAESTLASTPLAGEDTFTIQVSGYQGNASTSPYVLRVDVDQDVAVPSCTAYPIPTLSSTRTIDLSALADPPNTIILANWGRLAGAYGSHAADEIFASAETLLASEANGVSGVVIPVEGVDGNTAISSAYDAWDANPCDAEAANNVVSAITALVGQIQADHPTLAHVVVIGNDDMVPFARLSDLTEIANESTYTDQFNDSALYGSLLTRHYLSDDPYGDLDPIPWLDRYLHVPELAVGRLVEEPADIVQALDHFVTFGGELDPLTASVSGYDFLDDGSTAVSDRLVNILGATNVSGLIDTASSAPTGTEWTKGDLLAELDFAGGATADIFSVNAHSDHYRQLPSVGDATNDESDLFEVGDVNVLPESLFGSVAFTMGCHAGLSVSDIGIGNANPADWAQTYLSEGALYVANTGFGYGDTAGIALSERLMAEFAENLDGTMTVGQALTFAKQEYFAQLGQYPVYDEKAMQQAVFYGLPMYSLGTVSPAAPPAPLPTATDPATALEAATISFAPTYVTNSTPEGDYLSIDGQTQQTHYRPTQPLDGFDVTQDGLLAHGAIITEATTSDISNFDPVFFRPNVTGSVDVEPEAATDEIATPAFGLNIATYNRPGTGPNGEPFEQAQRATIIAGSFLSPADGSQIGVQRQIEAAQIKVLYEDPLSTDFTAPRILGVDSALIGNHVSFTVVTDTTDIAQVLVLYRNEVVNGISSWISTSLVEDAGSPGIYSGGGPVQSSGIVGGVVDYKIWIIDNSGNVSTTDFKNVFWQAATVPPPTAGDNLSAVAEAPDADPWHQASATVTVTGTSGVTYTYSGPGGLSGSGVGPSFGFEVTADGVNFIEVTGGGETATLTVLIDTTAPLTPVISSPLPGQVLEEGTDADFDFSCPDIGSGAVSCVGVLSQDGSVVDPIVHDGDGIDPATEGSFSLTITATDIFGRSTVSDPADYHVIRPLEFTLPPAALGSDAELDATLSGLLGTTSVEIDWGDGTSDQLLGSPAGGDYSISGTHQYIDGVGVYPVTLTVTHIGGYVQTAFAFAVVYDPSAGFVTGGGWIDSPVGAYTADPSLTGKASFGFVSKYKKGANVPTGNTTFKFAAGDFEFESTSYDWLVIAGSKGQYKGRGLVNEALAPNGEEYKFFLVGFDADVNDNDSYAEDRFRIRIWYEDDGTEVVAYDNHLGSPDVIGDDEEVAGATTALGGGSIKIHAVKGKT